MHPKSKKRFTLKIILSYAVLGVLATLAAFFIYNEFKSYASAKNQGESNEKLLKTNRLLTQLYDAENLSKLALQTKKPQDLKYYAQKVDSITQFIDSLKPLAQTNSGSLNLRLDSVQELLKQKVFNNAELRKLKVRNENKTSLDSVLKAFHEMEVDMGRITPETFAPNFDKLPTRTQEYIKEYVAILNKNIPNSDGNATAKNIDSILEVSKAILNKAKTETVTAERTVLQKELQIYRTDLELSQKMRGILSDFEQEMALNTHLDSLKQEQALKKSSRLAVGAVILGLITVILFTLMISKDYWKAQQYRERLEKAKKYSESLLKSREQLISTVSHDLRTPLNTIRGYSDLIEQSGLSTKQLNYLKKIKSSSGYVDNLVNDLLDYSKLEAGKIQLDKVPFALFQLIEETAVDFEEIQSKKRVLLQLKIADDLKKPIINDPFRIRQILTNLIGNAFKFTDSGHVRVAAVVEEKNKATWVRIDVEDTGIGIAVEKQEAIFQEFTQAEAPSQKAQVGYGLGLTISRKLTELLGGTLSLKSKVGKGSTFTVRIPVEFSKIEVVENDSKAFISKPKELSILVIDDDENMLGLISEVCKINDIKTKTILNFDDFELSKIHQFDAVLTDIQMPTTNGFSVLKTIKSIGYKNPVIAMTGQQIGNKADYLEPGFSDVLQKPFTANSLLRVLKSTEKVALSNAIPASESSMFTLKNISPFLDDPNAIQEVLQVFLENTKKNLAFLLSAVGDKDYTDIRATSHKMLPMFRQLEIQDAIHLLELLENISDDTKGEKTFKILSELKKVLSNLETEIQNYLAIHSIDID
ncbi:hybrid sensor histidine kinase/response regulator [Flagellimonas halotolerans]|uniref:histidine kinase n=1 Tax=Flagellimonas halotolerans TaxID=3112164 RepID=A0ABU6IP68_9FLAO|nr:MULTISPECIES: ATP-binding protein [unclassified Allomuricauda]MEC3964822.1 ATP-binding protein [Muricauda sp. SYSU M86414]MEC4264814.1 ATP-binding protein [Muricauda sp. SYSU M84420]